MKDGKTQYTKSSGNIFTDMGCADSEERLAKAKLAMCIEKIINKSSQRGWGLHAF